RESALVLACDVCEDRSLAIALNRLHGNIEVQQTGEGFARHRPRSHVAPNHYLIYFGLMNILEYRFQCGEVAMNVIDCSDAHDGQPLQRKHEPPKSSL